VTVQRRRETTEEVVEEAASVTAHVTAVDARDTCLVNAQMVDKVDLVAEVADMEAAVVVVEEAAPATIVVERVTLPVIVLRSQRKGEAVVVVAVAGHATDVVILDMLRVNALLRTLKLVAISICRSSSNFFILL